MEKLIQFIKNSLADELEAGDSYETIINMVDSSDEFDNNTKLLIISILEKIDTDEKTHKTLLSSMLTVLESLI